MSDDHSMPEITPIPGREGYGATRDGRIFTRLRRRFGLPSSPDGEWKPMALWPGRAGYPAVVLRVGPQKSAPFFVHRLILETFVGPCPEGCEARHLDGTRTNNRIENLAWGTRVENMADRKRHGRDAAGERHFRARLNPAAVREIRRLRNQGLSQQAIADRYGVSQHAISCVLLQKTWAHVL